MGEEAGQGSHLSEKQIPVGHRQAPRNSTLRIQLPWAGTAKDPGAYS